MKYFFTYLEETERVETIFDNQKVKETFKLAILDLLKSSKIHNLTNNSNSIKFKAPLFRFTWNGFNLFNPVSNGRIKIEEIGNSLYVSYTFYFWEFFVYSLIFSTFPLLSSFMPGWVKILSLLIIWSIYIISSLLAAHRFENFLKNIISEAEFIRQEQ
jgi:hypothetical protein